MADGEFSADKLKGVFNNKIGPLPGYAWLGIMIMVIVVYQKFFSGTKTATIATTSGIGTNATDSSGSAVGYNGGSSGGAAGSSSPITYTGSVPTSNMIGFDQSNSDVVQNTGNGAFYQVTKNGLLYLNPQQYAALGSPTPSSTYNLPNEVVKLFTPFDTTIAPTPLGSSDQATLRTLLTSPIQRAVNGGGPSSLGIQSGVLVPGNPVALAAAGASTSAAPVGSTIQAHPGGAFAQGEGVRSYVVQPGDTSESIASSVYNDPTMAPVIAANNDVSAGKVIGLSTG